MSPACGRRSRRGVGGVGAGAGAGTAQPGSLRKTFADASREASWVMARGGLWPRWFSQAFGGGNFIMLVQVLFFFLFCGASRR